MYSDDRKRNDRWYSEDECSNYGSSSSRHNGVRAQLTPKPLKFAKAMNDFHVMFPELDRDVIETILRANNGIVQSTIDQLLVLQKETQIEREFSKYPKLPSYNDSISIDPSEEPPPAYSAVWNDDTVNTVNEMSYKHCDTTYLEPTSNHKFREDLDNMETRKKIWNAPLIGNLPDDFLKLSFSSGSPNQMPSTASCSVSCRQSMAENTSHTLLQSKFNTMCDEFMTDEELEQYFGDKRLALFLQNEEFILELKHNPDFLMSLESDIALHKASRNAVLPLSWENYGSCKVLPCEQDKRNVLGSVHGATPLKDLRSNEDFVFRQKLKHMGKSTKSKFGRMAKRFSKMTGTSHVPPTTIRATDSTVNLLEEQREQRNVADFEGISNIEYGYCGDVETDDEITRNVSKSHPVTRHPPSLCNQRVQSSNSGTDEPIVFYSEDNEFSYKCE